MRTRIKSLARLAELRDRELRLRSGELVRLQNDLQRLKETREALDRARAEGCRASTPEAMPYLAGFLASIDREDGQAAAAESQVQKVVEVKRGEVLRARVDFGSVDRLKEILEDRQRRDSNMREAAETDERNLIGYGRAVRQRATADG
ncbi:flagellar FliJ family protein [Paracoccus ravus]|uniref:flagellar FliJ family protein n=1 Tax=Paracoccus ravus TaxID=2447760 RepID=UPI00106EFED5|nr:flagellar FliJ family protein [Paracoccus ravus]